MPPVRAKPNTAFKPPRPLNNKAAVASASTSTKAPANRSTAASKGKNAAAAAGPSTTKTASKPGFKPASIPISSGPEASEVEASDNDDDEIMSDASLAQSSLRAGGARRKTATPPPDSDTESAVPPPTQLEAPPIPAKLLNKLLHEGFEDEDMRIGKEAMAVTGKYIEVFVREAMARAVFERREQEAETGGVGDGFLQVEDLEKLAPQLLLDF